MTRYPNLARALRDFDPIRSIRCRWEYWNSSTQRQVRYVSGFWVVVGLLAGCVVFVIAAWAAILPR